MLPPELIAAMREHCRNEESFGIGTFDEAWRAKLSYYDEDGPPEGEEGTFDVYELMRAVGDEFEFTEDGWDSFIVDRYT